MGDKEILNQAVMPVRMLQYLTDVMLDYPNTPVRQYLVYIGKQALGMADGLNLPNLAYRYELIDMHRVDSESLLLQDSPDAWMLAVLCDFRDRPPREFVRGILDRLVRALHETPGRLRDYVSMLEILASNRDLNVDIQEELEMLTIELEKLPTYRMGLKKGHEEEKTEIAEKLLEMGLDVLQIASATGLPVADIRRLRAKKIE
jgi:predicted transposase YdaD